MKSNKPQMDVCTSCRKLYPRVYIRLCQSCAADEDKRFDLIRTFLDLHMETAVGIPEIVGWTGLSRGDVVRFYEQGRLVEIDPGLGGRPTVCTCASGAKQRCAFCRMNMAEGMRTQLENKDSRRPVGETAGTLAPASQRGPSPGLGGGSVRHLPQRGSQGDREQVDGDDGRVQYVRRIRRSN